MSPIMSSIPRKISQASRFPAKSPDFRRNKFVFVPKQLSRFEAYLSPDVIWLKNCRSKKQCLGGLKCSQNATKNKKKAKGKLQTDIQCTFY